MKIYDKEMYKMGEKYQNIIIIVVVFLIGFFIGYITNFNISENITSNTENVINLQ